MRKDVGRNTKKKKKIKIKPATIQHEAAGIGVAINACNVLAQ
jgi:hypothetical protein